MTYLTFQHSGVAGHDVLITYLHGVVLIDN